MSYEARIRWADRAMMVLGPVYFATALFVDHGTLTYVLSVLCLISLAVQVAVRFSFLSYQIADLRRQVGVLATEVYRTKR